MGGPLGEAKGALAATRPPGGVAFRQKTMIFRDTIHPNGPLRAAPHPRPLSPSLVLLPENSFPKFALRARRRNNPLCFPSNGSHSLAYSTSEMRKATVLTAPLKASTNTIYLISRGLLVDTSTLEVYFMWCQSGCEAFQVVRRGRADGRKYMASTAFAVTTPTPTQYESSSLL